MPFLLRKTTVTTVRLYLIYTVKNIQCFIHILYMIYVALFIYFTVVFGLLLVIRLLFLFNHRLLVFSELEFCFIQTSNRFFLY